MVYQRYFLFAFFCSMLGCHHQLWFYGFTILLLLSFNNAVKYSMIINVGKKQYGIEMALLILWLQLFYWLG
jgi:hypothetical protein